MLPRVSSPANQVPPAASASDKPEPLQLGLLCPSLSPEERQCYRQHNLCPYCGAMSCESKCLSSSTCSPPALTTSVQVTLPLSFQLPRSVILVSVIIDYGACSCFIDLSFTKQHQIPLQTKAQWFSVFLTDGSSIKSGVVTQETIPLPVSTSYSNYKELLWMDAISSPLYSVILGML